MQDRQVLYMSLCRFRRQHEEDVVSKAGNCIDRGIETLPMHLVVPQCCIYDDTIEQDTHSNPDLCTVLPVVVCG